MPTMEELLSPEALKRLQAAPTAEPEVQPEAQPEAKAPKHPRKCDCERRHDGFRRDGEVMVHRACGRPMPETAMLRGAIAQPVVMACATGCGRKVTVPARSSAPTQARIVACQPCATALSAGSPVTVVATRSTAAPIGVAVSTTQEKPMSKISIDLPSAQLGDVIKKAERERIASDLPEKRKKAKAKVDKREKKQAKAIRAERKSLTDVGVLPGFTLGKVEVPALDVSAVASLQETLDGKARSPYNKALSHLKEPTLPHKDEPGIGVKAVTWGDIVPLHKRLAALAAEAPAVEAKPATPEAAPKKAKAPKAQIAAPIDLTEKAKIAAIRKVVGCTKAEARAILASV